MKINRSVFVKLYLAAHNGTFPLDEKMETEYTNFFLGVADYLLRTHDNGRAEKIRRQENDSLNRIYEEIYRRLGIRIVRISCRNMAYGQLCLMLYQEGIPLHYAESLAKESVHKRAVQLVITIQGKGALDRKIPEEVYEITDTRWIHIDNWYFTMITEEEEHIFSGRYDLTSLCTAMQCLLMEEQKDVSIHQLFRRRDHETGNQ